MLRPLSSLTRLPVLGICALLGCGLQQASAQEKATASKAKSPPPPELVQLQQQYALKALASGRMLADQYSNALTTLEAQAAEAGDYDTALAAQRRRLDLASLYSKLPDSNADAIVLHPADAKTSGAVNYDRNEDSLVSWRVTGSSAYWDLMKITPGEFDVTMSYGVADSAESPPRSLASSKPEDFLTGGDVEFVEVTGLSGSETNRLQSAVAPTGGWTKFASLSLGTLKLTRTSTRLMLRVSHSRGGGGVMHLKEIRLTPSKPHAAPAETGNPASGEFAKIRSDHETRLRALEQPLVDSYKAKLQKVAEQFTAAKDTENAEAVKMEAQRADHALAQTAASRPGMQIAASAEGFEEIRDATFIDAPSNTGDQFLISANSQQIPVRLLWVTCPSPLAEDTANHKYHSQYFGISVDDSVALGRQAQEFTAAYLKDKSLRVLTRWQKDKNGAILASIQPAELGDFAGILVDNGLAAVNPPKDAKTPTRRRSDENAIAVLKERETTAKAKPLPPGAWSLSTGKAVP